MSMNIKTKKILGFIVIMPFLIAIITLCIALVIIGLLGRLWLWLFGLHDVMLGNKFIHKLRKLNPL